MRIRKADVRALEAKGLIPPGQVTARAKFGNRRTDVGGLTFDSAKEANRWAELLLLQEAGVIRDLERQVPFRLVVNGSQVATYRADFVYVNELRQRVVEDAKGVRTDVYKLKAKLMKAIFGIIIQEV